MECALDATGRRDLYRLVARLLGEEIDAPLYRRLLAAQGEAHPWIEAEIAGLPEQAALEALHSEYCRLLVGPYPQCPPFASVVRGEAMLGGRARISLDELLASLGLVVDTHARIPSSDHVAVVFAALAELSDPAQIAACLRDVVLPWVPGWLSALERAAERALFRTLARVAIALLEEEQMSLIQTNH
jgi:TorA maturation chaperone TorD